GRRAGHGKEACRNQPAGGRLRDRDGLFSRLEFDSNLFGDCDKILHRNWLLRKSYLNARPHAFLAPRPALAELRHSDQPASMQAVIPGWCVSTRPGTSRFRIRCCASLRNDRADEETSA